MQAPIPFPRHADAVVVGARAAGAATAMLLARAGLRVLVVDRGREGADTLSTHALMRAGVLQLHRWGLLEAVRAAGTPAVRRATFHYAGEALAFDVNARDGVDALFAPRRTLLDPLLVQAARAAGARVEHQVTALSLLEGAGGRVRGVVLGGPEGPPIEVEAGIVIGADGLHSRVAMHVGAATERTARNATATIYGHWSSLPVEGYHWYYQPGLSAGAIPTNGGQTCVFVAMPPPRYALGSGAGLGHLFWNVLAEAAPDLAEAARSARLDEKLHPFPGTPGFLRRASGPGWALVGDAGYFKDPLTAHGLTDALRDAELLARAVVQGGDDALAAYQAARDGASLPLFELTDRIASFDWDLAAVRTLHQQLSKAMAAEVDLLRGLAVPALPGAAEAHPPRLEAICEGSAAPARSPVA